MDSGSHKNFQRSSSCSKQHGKNDVHTCSKEIDKLLRGNQSELVHFQKTKNWLETQKVQKLPLTQEHIKIWIPAVIKIFKEAPSCSIEHKTAKDGPILSLSVMVAASISFFSDNFMTSNLAFFSLLPSGAAAVKK